MPVQSSNQGRATSLGRIGWAMVLVVALAACGTRGTIALVDPQLASRNVLPVVVATSRAVAPPPEYFSGERDFSTNYARFEVSIPPDRELGKIRYPKGTPNPQTDFVVTDVHHLDGPAAFIDAVNEAALAAQPRGPRTGAFFVHGFNTNFAEALIKNAQLKNDIGGPGVDVMFSWPSEAKLLAYVADRENALFTREPLAETLALMSRTNLTGYNLVAHSMGTFATMETLRSLALAGDRKTLNKIKAVILISADIEVDVFRRQAPPVLAAGVPIYLLVANDDKALRLSAVIRGERKRVGSVRTKEDLGGLDVPIIDLSAIDSKGDAGHLKVGTSPELIAFIRKIRENGITIFEDDQKVGVFDKGAVLLQSTTGIVVGAGP